MTWRCGAIDHGITFFPDGKIGPCCQISSNYLKDITEINNPDRFADLKQESPPSACEKCIIAEQNGLSSYRKTFNNADPSKGLQYIDIRNSNRCNLKCRYCSPYFSNLWGRELGIVPELKEADITPYYNLITGNDVKWMYFTGGEPFMSKEHWEILQSLINSGRSKYISLYYNTNMTLFKYKNLDIIDIWRKFQSVYINASIDAIGETFEYIRSGAKWETVEHNLRLAQKNNVSIQIFATLSILNIWSLDELSRYCQDNNYNLSYSILTGPTYLALDVIPDELKDQALKIIDSINDDSPVLKVAKKMIIDNHNQWLIDKAINHILLIDNIRNENLFRLLPFISLAKQRILNNHEYETK